MANPELIADPTSAVIAKGSASAHAHAAGAEHLDLSHSDALTAKMGSKLGHHTIDHMEELEEHKHGAKQHTMRRPLKLQNPLSSAAADGLSAGVKGGLLILGFTGLMIGAKAALTFIFPGLEHLPALALALSGAISGLAWYGGHRFISSYQEKSEQNAKMLKQMDARERGLDHAMAPEREQAPSVTAASSRSFDPAMAAIVGAAVTAQADDRQTVNKTQPAFISKIVQDGPKRFSPKEMAERLSRERAFSSETGL